MNRRALPVPSSVSSSFVVACALVGGCAVGCVETVDVPGPEPLGPVTLSFVDVPAALSEADDIDAATAGVQVQLTLSRGGDGAGFDTVSVNTLVGTTPVAVSSTAFDDSGNATVVVTLQGSADGQRNTLRAVASTADLRTVAVIADVTVTDARPQPAPPSCTAVGVAAGAVLLDSDPLAAGIQQNVTVRCSGGDPAVAAQQTLLSSGSVLVTTQAGGVIRGFEVTLNGGEGARVVTFGAAGPAALIVRLIDGEGVFRGRVEQTLFVEARAAD